MSSYVKSVADSTAFSPTPPSATQGANHRTPRDVNAIRERYWQSCEEIDAQLGSLNMDVPPVDFPLHMDAAVELIVNDYHIRIANAAHSALMSSQRKVVKVDPDLKNKHAMEVVLKTSSLVEAYSVQLRAQDYVNYRTTLDRCAENLCKLCTLKHSSRRSSGSLELTK